MEAGQQQTEGVEGEVALATRDCPAESVLCPTAGQLAEVLRLCVPSAHAWLGLPGPHPAADDLLTAVFNGPCSKPTLSATGHTELARYAFIEAPGCAVSRPSSYLRRVDLAAGRDHLTDYTSGGGAGLFSGSSRRIAR